MATIVLTADGNTITSQVRPESFLLETNVTSKVDTLTFTYRKYGSRTYVPAVTDVVSITVDGVKTFEGTIVEIKEKVDGKDILIFEILVKDYTHLIDQILIAETYENDTVKDIVDDIVANWLPAGITGNNVSTAADLTTLEFIQFDYSRPSDVLSDLAALIGFDWWIDYDKDLHFVAKGTQSSPFNLTDTNAKYKYRSLELIRSEKQVRNKIIVEGGEYVGASTTDKIGTGDGTQKTFNLPYKYDAKPTVTVNAVSQTIGVLYLDDPSSFDALWSQSEKILVWDTAPTDTHAIEVTGLPLIPLLIQLTAPGSIAAKGTFEFKITDKTLKTQDAVRKRAEAEIEQYADTIQTGSFETTSSGLAVGQRITINSSVRGIVNEEYVIQQITTMMRTHTTFVHYVKLSTVKSYEIIEFLRHLLRIGEKTLGIIKDPASVLNIISSLDVDNVEITELLEVNQYKVDLTGVDSVDATDSMLNAGIDDPPTWVYGTYAPTSDADRKRPPKYDRGARYVA